MSKAKQAVKSHPWDPGRFRLFISHKAENKLKAKELKEALRKFGIACFVAHTDITPTKKWRKEILAALSSMHGLVALITESFHESDWTDQEIGYALGRGIHVVPVRLGADPYGFIGEDQAVSCDWRELPMELMKIYIAESRVCDAFIDAASRCNSFDEGNTLAKLLPNISSLSVIQEKKLIGAYNGNGQLKGSYGFTDDRISNVLS